jgi:hypothetical protein
MPDGLENRHRKVRQTVNLFRAQNRRLDGWRHQRSESAPHHSFRHYLKSVLLDRDVPERISDAITGHKTPGIGRKYEHVERAKKFEAISKLPVIPLAGASR